MTSESAVLPAKNQSENAVDTRRCRDGQMLSRRETDTSGNFDAVIKLFIIQKQKQAAYAKCQNATCDAFHTLNLRFEAGTDSIDILICADNWVLTKPGSCLRTEGLRNADLAIPA